MFRSWRHVAGSHSARRASWLCAHCHSVGAGHAPPPRVTLSHSTDMGHKTAQRRLCCRVPCVPAPQTRLRVLWQPRPSLSTATDRDVPNTSTKSPLSNLRAEGEGTTSHELFSRLPFVIRDLCSRQPGAICCSKPGALEEGAACELLIND